MCVADSIYHTHAREINRKTGAFSSTCLKSTGPAASPALEANLPSMSASFRESDLFSPQLEAT